MSTRGRWLALALTLWGIPSFLFWVGMGLFSQLNFRAASEERGTRLEKVLESSAKECREEKWLETALREACGMMLDGRAMTASASVLAESLEKQFPEGMARVYLFDGNGTLLPRERQHEPVGAQNLFAFVRCPWEDVFQTGPSFFGLMDGLLEDGYELARQIRGRPRRLLEVSGYGGGLRRPTKAYFDWKPSSPGTSIAGFLALIYENGQPLSSLLRRSFKACGAEGCALGLVTPDGMTVAQAPLSASETERLASLYWRHSADRFVDGGRLVRGLPLMGKPLLLAVCDLPADPFARLIGPFFLFAVVSLFLLAWLYRIAAGVSRFRATLIAKMTLLFGFGVAMPVVFSGSLAMLYLTEKEGEIFQRHRQNALDRLGLIDAGFERILAAREREYHRLLGHHKGFPVTIESVKASLSRLYDAVKIESIYFFSPDGEILMRKRTPRDPDYLLALRLPMELRRRMFYSQIEYDQIPHPAEIDGLMGRMTLEEVARAIPRGDEKKFQNLVRLLQSMSREIIEASNLGRGFAPAAGYRKAGVDLGAVGGEAFDGMITVLRANLGKFSLVERTVGNGFLYCGNIFDANGRAIAFVVMFHAIYAVEMEYLDRLFARRARPADGRELCVFMNNGFFSRHYREPEDCLRYRSILKEFESTDATALSLRMPIDGVEMEVSARRGVLMKDCILLEATPVTAVMARIRPFRHRAFAFVLASILFSLGAGILLIRQVLVPLRDLSRGVQALREKNFSYRVVIRRNDELGIMCDALNRTIAHLENMDAAAVIQQNLLPLSQLKTGPYALFGKNQMTQAIGGDYFDFIPVPDGRVAVVLGDVSGHGVSAALVTAMAKAAFTLLCPLFPDDPGEVLRRVNDQFLAILDRKKMMSCCLIILDPRGRIVRVANAGHCFPLLMSRSGTTDEVKLNSNPLGALKKGRFATGEIDLSNGGLVLYSDGLIEATNAGGDMVGYERFFSIVGSSWTREPEPSAMAAAILREVQIFTDPVPWGDDATVVVVRLMAEREPAFPMRS